MIEMIKLANIARKTRTKYFVFENFPEINTRYFMCVCVCVCVYPSSSLGWRYGMNGNSGSCRQPN